MASPTSNNEIILPPSISATNLSRLPSPEPSQPISRPPSYKLDTHVDLDALEIEYQQVIQSQKDLPRWRYQFRGMPLVFWLVLFVLLGVVSLFIPQFPPAALALWLPLILYFVVVMVVHIIHRRKAQSLHHVQCQLNAIQLRREHALTQVTEYDNDIYFLHAMSSQHTHPFTTLLPPPPTYQKNQ